MCHSNSLTFKSLKIFLATWTLVAVISPPSVVGNPITKRVFKKVIKLLEDNIQKEIPSDAEDQFSDLLFQEQYDKKNVTYYHAGNKKFPVFISNGFGNIGSPVHVLLRGEDYINPKDRNNFVVLKKAGDAANAYSVHRAHIIDVLGLRKGSKILWNDGRVEQQKNIKPLLRMMGNYEVQARSMRAQRPLCDWMGYSLMCNTKMNIPPARERKEREPMDEEDNEPVNLPGIVSEESKLEGMEKQKRFVNVEDFKDIEKEGNKNKIGNEFVESGEDGSEEGKSIPIVQETEEMTKVTPRTRATTTTRRVILVQQRREREEKEAAASQMDGERQEEQVTKKKHKRKHKPKKKNAETITD